MAVEWDTSLPSHEFLPLEEGKDDDDDDVNPLLSHSQGKDNSMNEKEDDFIAELTHHMDRFFLQDDDDDHHDIHKSRLSSIGSSHNISELSWEMMSPQSTLWSPLCSNQGSSEGSSSQEPSPPHTPHNKKNNGQQQQQQHPCWRKSPFDIQASNIGLCSSYQSLIHQQIRAIELSGLKQEQVLTQKPKPSAYGERQSEGQIDSQESEAKEQIDESEGKKGDESGVGRRRRRRRRNPPRHAPLLLQIQTQQQQQSGAPATMRAVFLGGPSSVGGTGVFLPRAAAGGAYTLPPESTMKQGKGCSTVLIPARVVQALQQHFDQMAATSKPAAFPPLHDVLVSNRDSMYSLQNQKRRSRKAPATASVKDEMTLPQDWTY